MADVLQALVMHSTAAIEIPCSNETGGVAPLFIAAQEGHTDCVHILLACKAEPNRPNNLGATPLYIAVQNNHNETSAALLAAGADPNCSTDGQLRGLPIAVFHCNATLVRILLAAGAWIDVVGGRGDKNTPAMQAAHSLDIDILCQVRVLDTIVFRSKSSASHPR